MGYPGLLKEPAVPDISPPQPVEKKMNLSAQSGNSGQNVFKPSSPQRLQRTSHDSYRRAVRQEFNAAVLTQQEGCGIKQEGKRGTSLLNLFTLDKDLLNRFYKNAEFLLLPHLDLRHSRFWEWGS